MKVSDYTEKQLLDMSFEQKWNFLCGEIHDENKTADIALVLGGRPVRAAARAHDAAKLWLDGRVRHIVVSGGVKWDVGGEMLTEAEYMRKIIIEDGVDENAVTLENEARTTKENMILGTLVILRKFRFKQKRIMIVSSIYHLKRSLALAKTFLPRMVELTYYPSQKDTAYEECMGHPEYLDRCIHIIYELIQNGIIDDMDI